MMTSFGKHSTTGLILSDPRTLTRPRPPWRRRDPHRERCAVCGVGAVYVVTALLSMQSPTLELPATLVTLACERCVKRTAGALRSIDVHVRSELLYETWRLRWTTFGESLAAPFARLAHAVTTRWWALMPLVRAVRPGDRRITVETVRVMAKLDVVTSPGSNEPPLTKPTSMSGLIDL